MFKVGDRIRVKREVFEQRGSTFWTGGDAIITKIAKGSPISIEAESIDKEFYTGLFSEKEIELVPEEIGTVKVESWLLPQDAADRKTYPIGTGVLNYFPSALLQISKVSYLGNQQHNPGEPLHHARGKSKDHYDTIIRHLMEAFISEDQNKTFRLNKDTDGSYHLAKACWRVLAYFQEALEREGAPLAPGAKLPQEKK